MMDFCTTEAIDKFGADYIRDKKANFLNNGSIALTF
jgi:hypothetical protein